MNLEIKEENGVYTGTLTGWIDTAIATELKEAMKPLMDNADKTICLDCSGLEYICSLGLRHLLTLRKESASKGGKLKLTKITDEFRGILTMTGFIKLFDIE